MLEVGKVVELTVVRSGSWGVYVRTTEGVVGYVDAVELSWSHSVNEDTIPKVGEDIKAVVTRVFAEPMAQGARFVASVRQLAPDNDPWGERNRYSPGMELTGRVILVGEGFLLLELPSGATAGVRPVPFGFELGQLVDVILTSVDVDAKRIIADLRA